MFSFAGEDGDVPVRVGALGAWVSTLKLRAAAVGSVLAAASVARTSKLWEPSESGAEVGVWVAPGPLQGPKAAESKRQAKLDPASEEWKEKLGAGLLVGPEGPESIVVSGGVESMAATPQSG